MDLFLKWCLQESQKPIISEEQLFFIAQEISGQTFLGRSHIDRLVEKLIPDSVKKLIRDIPQYQQMQRNLIDSVNPLTQQQLREKVAKSLEQELNSPIVYQKLETLDPLKQDEPIMLQVPQSSFVQFKQDLWQQAQQVIESPQQIQSGSAANFKEGDKIRMNESADSEYRLSKAGSEGTIIQEIGNGVFGVKFSKLTGCELAPHTYEIYNIYQDYMEDMYTLKELAEQMGGSRQLAQKMVDDAVVSAIEQMAQGQTQRLKEQFKTDLRNRFVGELKGSHLFREVTDDSYMIDQLELLNVLGKKAYGEAMEMASFNKKPVQSGKHKSKLAQHNGYCARYKKSQMITSGLAILPIMRNSITRRIYNARGPTLHEDDLVIYDSEKNVSYAVVFLVDANKCITKNVSGTKNAAISLYYMMKRFYPSDSYEFIRFNDEASVINLDQLLTMGLEGCRDSGKAVDLGIERLDRYKGKQRVMYLITDGNPCGYGEGDVRQDYLIDKARELKRKDIQLVILAMCKKSDDFYEFAKKVTRTAGGVMYHIPDAKQLASYTVQSFKDLRKKSN